jgi:predicted ATPase
LTWRALALWVLGYPEAAVADTDCAIEDAREVGQAATLFALSNLPYTHICCGNYDTANAQAQEAQALADEKGGLYWKVYAMIHQGCVLALTGKTSNAVQQITSRIAAYRPTGSTIFIPWALSYLARAYADLNQFDDAWRCIGEAMTRVETTKERWCEADIHRTAGEIALMSPDPDAKRAEAYFEIALAVARKQQAKSWEVRAAMSMARLWRDQGKSEKARDLSLRSTTGSPKASTRLT